MIFAMTILVKMFVIFAYLVFLAFAVHVANALPNCAVKRLLLVKVFD